MCMHRQSEAPLRIAALQLVAAVVGGLGGGDRNSAGVQTDALKAVARVAKENTDSECRLAVAGAQTETPSRHLLTCLTW